MGDRRAADRRRLLKSFTRSVISAEKTAAITRRSCSNGSCGNGRPVLRTMTLAGHLFSEGEIRSEITLTSALFLMTLGTAQ
jgi:hypothetical protein